MTAASKKYIVCLLCSLMLIACEFEGSTRSDSQTPGATIQPTPIGVDVTGSVTGTDTTLAIAPSAPLHAAFNTQGDITDLIALGFNLFDVTGSKTNPAETLAFVNALPEKTQALVWLGNLGNAPTGKNCPAPGFSDVEFKAVVDTLANNPKVFGYNLADEPHPSICPDSVDIIKARSDYIHTYAPGQMAYITVQDGSNMCPAGEGCEYSALRPEITHVDLIGIDPYPCHFNNTGQPVTCDTSKISQRVKIGRGEWNSRTCHCSHFSGIWAGGQTGWENNLLQDTNNDRISRYAQPLELSGAKSYF